ncbi:DNA primase, partial [Bacteroidales bacterium AH-315-I05]|nr:DNA primase [Bacteroidales bacterium AH-315-I05]
MIPKETIAIIIETADVVEVLGEFVSLKKKGKDYWACCPFHNEKTPSFSVSHKGFYKCFGCGESGNAINFLMEHEHYTYPEALKYLANKYNIEIQEQELTPEMEQQQNEREALYIVSAYAEKFFIEQLNDTDEGKSIGLSYFKERGFSNETIEKFKLGYCPDQWDVLTKTALDAGYKLEYLLQTGLSKERNNQHYDGYRGRVIFPIHNLSGRPIAFGGRTLKTDKKIPKYVNTSECDIYHKSKVLYGIYFAKKAIISEDNCYLVEGYTDVISLHQSGIENVVASSGTSLTIEQIRLIKRYTPNITILYDGDAAGIKASFRGIDLILEEGMNVKIVLFPEGEDPDSYAKKSSPEELKEFITSSSKDFIVFKTETLQIESQNDPVKKAGLIHEIINSIALIPDHIARSLYLKECSKILGISEKALIGELNKTLRKKFKQKFKKEEGFEPDLPVIELKAQPQFQPDDSCEYQEKDIIR